jgi:hypothetical protein
MCRAGKIWLTVGNILEHNSTENYSFAMRSPTVLTNRNLCFEVSNILGENHCCNYSFSMRSVIILPTAKLEFQVRNICQHNTTKHHSFLMSPSIIHRTAKLSFKVSSILQQNISEHYSFVIRSTVISATVSLFSQWGNIFEQNHRANKSFVVWFQLCHEQLTLTSMCAKYSDRTLLRLIHFLIIFIHFIRCKLSSDQYNIHEKITCYIHLVAMLSSVVLRTASLRVEVSNILLQHRCYTYSFVIQFMVLLTTTDYCFKESDILQ